MPLATKFHQSQFPAMPLRATKPVTTSGVRIEVEPATKHYKSGEIGPPEAMFLSTDVDWREFGLIEWRVK